MRNIDKVIQELIILRNQEKDPSIYKGGKIRDDVIVGDIMPLLNGLYDYEIPYYTKEQIKAFKDRENTEVYCSFDDHGNIDRDFSIWYNPRSPIGIFYMHTSVGAGFRFSEPVVFNINNKNNALMQFVNTFYRKFYQNIDIDDRYTANVYLLSDKYDVYDGGTDRFKLIGKFTTRSKNELIIELRSSSEG